MIENITYLQIDVDKSKRLFLRFIDDYRENRSNKTLTFSELTRY